MDILKINKEVNKVIIGLNQELTIDEKIAVLESSAALIRNVLSAEALKAMYVNYFKGK